MRRDQKASFFVRGAVALAMFVGFYVFAAIVAMVLLFIPYAQFRLTNSLSVPIAAVCIGGAGSILWAIVPRRGVQGLVPGARLSVAAEPRLFEAIRQVAAATDQPMPDEVYLVASANAFVTKRGGIFGLGETQVLALGLPLMQMLTISELRSVLAHEFGHFHGGDVRIGAIIYRGRLSILRTLESVKGTWFEGIIGSYWEMFLGVSSSISRFQEFSADRLSAEEFGRSPLVSGLRKAAVGDGAFIAYWEREIREPIRAGYAPPIVEGFSRFVEGQSGLLERLASRKIGEFRGSQFDSHPPLAERIEAIADVDEGTQDSGEPAVGLLSNPSGWDDFILTESGTDVTRLRRVAWADVLTEVQVPYWRSARQDYESLLRRMNWSQLPTSVADAIGFATPLKREGDGYVPGPELARRLAWLVGAACSLQLLDAGWELTADPGSEVRALRDGMVIEPFVLCADVIFGRRRMEDANGVFAPAGIEGPIVTS